MSHYSTLLLVACVSVGLVMPAQAAVAAAPKPPESVFESSITPPSPGAHSQRATLNTLRATAFPDLNHSWLAGLGGTILANPSLIPSCTSVSITPDTSSPAAVGSIVTLTGLAAGCPDPNPLYRFLLRSPSGVWSTVRGYSPSDTFAWHTSSYAPGTYQIGVWVKDSLSGFTYDAYALASFTLQSKPCAGVEVEPGSPSPKVPGDIINFVAIAGGCPDPQYRWLVRNPAGVWSTVAAYSASDSFSWNTTGRPSGTYQVGVWARQKGSNKSYETYGFVTYVLRGTTTAACQAVDLPANGISPSVVGTIFDFTATAIGCTPQYKWWIRDPAGHWAVVRNYSSSDTYTWNTASHAAGTYQIGVWVRRTGSIAAYEAYYTRTLTLVAAHNFFICTSAGVLSGASSPQAPGASISFTAGASGCISPEFKFLILAPGATTWTVVQPYGSNTFIWNTAGLSPGTWQVGVWARQVGSTASYQAYALLTFQLTFV